MIRIGLDVGGTKIEAIALDADGIQRLRRRVATPKHDYAGTVRAIRDLVAGVEQELGETGTVGAGIPGTISPASGLVKNANSTWLNGQPLDKDLAEALARPVRIANDANCFAISEAVDGAGRGFDPVFGVILGTGVGGGIVVNGRLLTGRNAVGGEWGHNPLPFMTAQEVADPPPSWCGHPGVIEAYLSGTGLQRDHEKVAGEALDGATIVARAANGDSACEATLQRYEDRLARALASIINVLDPGVIVLGGGMSNVERLYASVPQRWQHYVFSDVVETPLVKAAHGDSSGVRGAAWLWRGDADPDAA